MTVLLVCLCSAAFMAGLSWFVGAVHYPLFAGVGPAGWAGYHRRHSARTAWVVLPPMTAELATSGWLVADRPAGVPATLVAVGLALAAGTWLLTAVAARAHGRLGRERLDAGVHRALLTVHHARTALWSAHAALVAVLVAQAA
jgi:hypothetical protein